MAKFPENIMRKLREREDLEPNDKSMDKEINLNSQNEAFEKVLEWEGIIGYAHSIKGWIKDIYGVDVEEGN